MSTAISKLSSAAGAFYLRKNDPIAGHFPQLAVIGQVDKHYFDSGEGLVRLWIGREGPAISSNK